MSVVTSIVVWTFLDETAAMRDAQYWLKEQGYPRGLVFVNDQAGGNKALQVDVWVGAFNYFPTEGFIRMLRAQKWEWLSHVAAFVEEEESEMPTVYRVRVEDHIEALTAARPQEHPEPDDNTL